MAEPARPSPVARLKAWAKAIRRDVIALWLAARDPRVPWTARAFCAAIAAYALSPIDLIPDVIPVLGLLDEAILLPFAILLAVRLVPPALMAEFRAEADRRTARPTSRAGAAAVVALWLLALALIAWAAWPAA
ncbi:DUF1232 domain-containing protein [Rubellimicrobium rubrum]|uniref:DUF1232 domain-containing protein n=1 Tax=Rubellimicrobium rubrum TaxID=2585369 RepID=A0A5C4N5Z6_9RHOB|nr:DUF1232 domain-containing protein [Rubellimicrobium rubrum]TNC52069.1 DUF1232 domain-containing protein [Rubellimicrobium rubrum]